ncbi:MAG: HisA/HisF-related TIM barrel protein [Spirochaetales bacterium]|nr:HisA/HisF-related TIM barrel protein [Spirochaetales bacterium]
MIAIPAIDLIDGRCVRLTEGAFDTARVYEENPVAMAQKFAEAGVHRLHVVDLDAARGQGQNRSVIAQIRQVFPGILDVGGGVRCLDDARALRDVGVDLVVAGTALVKNTKDVARWTAELGPILSAGIDARDGEVRIAGWEAGSSIQAVDLAVKARELGAVEIIYTDISRDGTLSGPNIPETVAVAKASGLPVVLSGGIGGMNDLEELARTAPEGLSGVIFGKALYEGRVQLDEAITLFGRNK